jgi:tetratricopeptide (TPR) repeat protein
MPFAPRGWTVPLCVACVACAALGVRAAGQSTAADRTARAANLVDACRSRFDREDLKGAVTAARQAAAIDPANGEAALCLGVALVMLGVNAEAVAPLERALAAQPDNPDAMFALAKAYASLDDPRAERMLERLMAQRPGDVNVRLAFVEYLWDHGQNQRGNEDVERILAGVPGRPDLRVTYATELLRQWQFERAARQLEQAQAEGMKTYEVAYLLGNAWWEAGEIDRAVRSFSNAIAMDPSAARALHGLGRLLLWMGRAADAVPHLEKAAVAAPESSVTILDLGRAYESANRLPDAERAYRKALSMEPSLSPIYYALGRLLKRMGKNSEAAETLGKYQQLYEAEQQRRFYETSHRAELDSAERDLRHGDAAAALAKFERIGNTPDALIGKAKALSRLNRHAEAVRVLERVRLLAPKDQRVEYLLARERAAKGPGAPKR